MNAWKSDLPGQSPAARTVRQPREAVEPRDARKRATNVRRRRGDRGRTRVDEAEGERLVAGDAAQQGDRLGRRVENDDVAVGGVLAAVEVAALAADAQRHGQAARGDHLHRVSGTDVEQPLVCVLALGEHLVRLRRRAGSDVHDVDALRVEVRDADDLRRARGARRCRRARRRTSAARPLARSAATRALPAAPGRASSGLVNTVRSGSFPAVDLGLHRAVHQRRHREDADARHRER